MILDFIIGLLYFQANRYDALFAFGLNQLEVGSFQLGHKSF